MCCFAELMKQKLATEREQLLLEHDQEKSAYQKLLTDVQALEAKNEQLEQELVRTKTNALSHKVS